MKGILRSLLIPLLALPPTLLADAPDAVVTFHEIHYNPPVSQDGEWLELHNQMAVNIDLSGWSLADGVTYTVPKGTVIPPGGFLIIAKNPGHPSLAGISGVLGPFSGNLSNSGETIDLLSPTKRLMDRVTYGDDDDWPVAADGLGATLAKRATGLASGPVENWEPSITTGGTPGSPNRPPPAGPVTHTLISPASTWRVSDNGTAPPAGWNGIAFNDAAWAQGDAPFGEGFDATQLTVTGSLSARYRAGAVTGVASGATFPTWQDTQTADGASQHAAAGGSPRWIANATTTAEPVVRFDGASEFRTAIPPGIAPDSGFVYLIVCRANAPPASGQLNDGSGAYLFDREHQPNGSPLVSLKAVNGRYGFQRRNDAGGELGGIVSTTPISTNSFQVVAIRRNRAAARYELWIDGVMEASTPDSGAAITPQPIVIARHATAATGGFNGDIAELLIYRDGLTDEEFRNAGAYLAARYGVDTAFPDLLPATELAATPTRYLRTSFEFHGYPANATLRLEHFVADGAVFYLNGQEIARHNLPDGPPGHETQALGDLSSVASSGILSLPADALVQGTNVLAVSLHSAPPGTSAFFEATLNAIESPQPPESVPALRLSEITAAGDPAFFVEVHNSGSLPVMLGDWRITHHGLTTATFSPPAIALAPDESIAFSTSDLGFQPVAGDRIALRSPAGHPVDARTVTNRLRGLGDRYPNRWLFPSAPSPGAPNPFNLTDDIVIHEISYHPPDLAPIPGVPPTVVVVPLLPFNSVWRYNATGSNPGIAWAATAHPVGNGWLEGPGIHAYSPNTLPVATGTLLTNPRANSPYIISYYFEREFNLTADQAAGISALQWTQVIDDGAVFYLNGVEIHRYQMPAGTITASTTASATVNTAAITGPFTIPLPEGLAVSGQNRLSVQVHQVTSNSSDIAFGMNLSAIITTDPGLPEIPPRPSEDQWIELCNRGDQPVDLSGWNFSAGIQYLIPSGTILQPGGHLVIARDPAAHAGPPPLGPFEGNLSRGGETLILRDAFNNPADIVSYVDGGRWPEAADGGGATLELRNAHADNSLPESWAASDESGRHQWETIRYRGVAAASAVGPDGQWREFILGLLNSGEVLLDDISVTEDPDGAAIQLIQGGNFESGTAAWRFLGNHAQASVVPDPENPSNQVLHLRATGATEHMHNQVQTTLAAGRSIVNGRTYEISFRARWLRGTTLINTRLYFNRLARTHLLTRPSAFGTPGSPNSTAVANTGPGFTLLSHDPVVPAPGEPVTIRARAADPDGVASLTLHHSVNGGNFTSVPMTAAGSGEFTATIPGQSAAAVVRFHVSAIDAAEPPAQSWFPAAGPASHALYQVDDGLAATNGLQNLRIIMAPDDRARLHQTTNLMSNGRIGCTVIYNEREVYYNTGVRLKGSQRGRPQPARVGFNLGFNNDQPFRGVHRTIAIDRSEGQITGCQEILYDHMMNATGAVPAEYNDLVRVIAPDPAHTSAAILQLARYGNTYLDSQFENGSSGTVYEYELVYYPTTADAAGYKLPQPDQVDRPDIRDYGDDKERYRWTFLTKNNEDADDYSRIMAMAKRFSLSGTAFESGLEDVIDVDQWLGALAQSCVSGAGDSFFSNDEHNGQFYARPSDGRVLYLPHDMDFAYNATRSIFENQELQKLTANPSYRRTYLGYLHHICTTVFNQSGMAPWTTHYGGLLPGEDFAGHLSYINARSNHILSSINNSVAPVPFVITTNGGADFSTDDSPATLAGTGWVNVREIRLAGSATALPMLWTSVNTWQVDVPLAAGANPVTLEAWNLDGQIVGTDSIVITNTGGVQQPGPQTLVVSEMYYNPPGSSELTEYVELMNISRFATLDLGGLAFTDGITFTFPSGVMLPPLGRIVLAKDPAVFAATFGSVANLVGPYPDNLSNSGETLTLSLASGTVIRSFAYSDLPPWPVEADGDGHSLTLIDPLSNPDHSNPESWRASRVAGGSPGSDDEIHYDDWKLANGNHADDEDRDGDGLTTRVEYFVGGDPNLAEPSLVPQVTVEAGGSILFAVHRLAGSMGKVEPAASTDLQLWSRPPGTVFLGSTRLPGVPVRDRLVFRLPAPDPAGRLFVRGVFGD